MILVLRRTRLKRAKSGNPVTAVATTTRLQQPVLAEPYIPHPAMLSRQRLQGMAEGGWAMCPDLLGIQSSGKPIRSVSCHVTIADVHAAQAFRSVVRLEADSGSTRSRQWFDSKQIVIRLEVERDSTRSRMSFECWHTASTRGIINGKGEMTLVLGLNGRSIAVFLLTL